jgi:hypothetical protein
MDGRRDLLAGIGAGIIYVVLVRLAFAVVATMRERALTEVDNAPLWIATLAMLALGILTGVVIGLAGRWPALAWTAGVLLLLTIPAWPFLLSGMPDVIDRLIVRWSGDANLEASAALAGLLLASAIRVTWFVPRPPQAPAPPISDAPSGPV